MFIERTNAASAAIARNLETQTELLHACEAETSMMMAITPTLVAEDRIELAKVNLSPDVKDVVGAGVYRWRSLASRSSAGGVGNPSAATAKKGEQLFEAVSRELAEKLTHADFWQLPWR